ncbi:MAG: adenylate/guanylate cyclase domain-containing protein [Spirochaetes bacterium]|nr:adenylate/guanylate cyclase domain-containing protein [Spirochaetota bacterium]
MSPHPETKSYDNRVAAPLARLWPWVIQTGRFNRRAGLAPRTFAFRPDPRGGSRVFGEEPILGLRMKYEERPFEWVRHAWFEVERVFSSGTLHWLKLRSEFREENGATAVRNSIHFLARNAVASWLTRLVFDRRIAPGFTATYRELEASLGRAVAPVDPFRPAREAAPAEREALRAKLAALGAGSALADGLARFLLTADDGDLAKIRPWRFARQHGFDRGEVLSVFLKGVRAGLFELGWNLLCPSCRGPKDGTETLSDLKREGHCPSCNIDFTANFDESVELNFTPHESLRKVERQVYCTGGPGATAHVWFQVRLRGPRRLALDLEPGMYRLVGLPGAGSRLLHVDAGAEGRLVTARFPEPGAADLAVAPGRVEFQLEGGSTDAELLVRLERAEWLDDIVTAADAAAHQGFRELFSSEVLRPGQELALKSVTILFTDLKDSTRFYNEHGDPRAFAAVNRHFDVLLAAVRASDGAVVKTIGDAVMAVFTLPERGVEAAFRMLAGMAELNRRSGATPLLVKLGLHTGPALAVTLNERLDYFGQTVNLAARTEGVGRGNELILSRTLYDREAVRAFLDGSGARVEAVETKLKGFEDTVSLMRVVPTEASLRRYTAAP